ncbi:uncharacterized protein LOC110807621 [Carica papaya]|uniref:uncharacterized protein LOC110807621 n=1 Tax=Carica papaya TaxID=3649 RepID=UPI000B8D0857|nr:uncharacterized protein LOC110807621 [Carica papaya]
MAKFSNKFSMKSKYGALAVTATPIVILAGIYVGMAYASRYAGKRKHKANALGRSVSMGALHGGKLAVRRLIDYQTYRASETSSTDAEKELKALLEMETLDVKSLQEIAARLELSGKEGEAVEILRNALKDPEMQKKPHEAYEMEMLLAEMLIYKGDYAGALKCRCLQENNISDARRPLYKAIIHTILQDEEDKKGKEYFEEYKEIQSCLHWPPVSSEDNSDIQSLYISDFERFEKAVRVLKDDIEMAKLRSDR